MIPSEYNKELILVHKFLREQHQRFRESNKLKSDKERLQYAHAVKTIGDIAYNCNITPKNNPQDNKRPEYYNTVYKDT